MPIEADTVAISSETSTASESADDKPLTFYPAYCYNASPTWFTWVKLTAFEIHYRLQRRPEFQAPPSYITTGNGWVQNQPLLLFYLNHPVQFVQLVGVVVTFEDYLDRFWTFVLDDSSGATLEVNCRKPEKNNDATAETVENEQHQERDNEADARYITMSRLDVGTVVQIKGQITTFRDVRQLQLDRISIVHDTNQEMRLIVARTNFKDQVLRSPWAISPRRQKQLQEQAHGERNQDGERVRRRQILSKVILEREKRHANRIAKQYNREERKRQEHAEVARRAGQSIKK